MSMVIEKFLANKTRDFEAIDSTTQELQRFIKLASVFFEQDNYVTTDSFSLIMDVLSSILCRPMVFRFFAWLNLARNVGVASDFTCARYKSFQTEWNLNIEKLENLCVGVCPPHPLYDLHLGDLNVHIRDFRNWLEHTYQQILELVKPRIGNETFEKLCVCIGYDEESIPFYIENVYYSDANQGVKVLELSSEEYRTMRLTGKYRRTMCSATVRHFVPREFDLAAEADYILRILSQRLRNGRSLDELYNELETNMKQCKFVDRDMQSLQEIRSSLRARDFENCFHKCQDLLVRTISIRIFNQRQDEPIFEHSSDINTYLRTVMSMSYYQSVPKDLRKANLSLEDWADYIVYDSLWETLKNILLIFRKPQDAADGTTMDHSVKRFLDREIEFDRHIENIESSKETPIIDCFLTKYYHDITTVASSTTRKNGPGIIWFKME
ncbi:hypothetical protein MUP01_06430 [Candidatus Bathyarchaeota archaeon]|nr:hypothetical protein [Candidatus Bathyarchaeota archaeon]